MLKKLRKKFILIAMCSVTLVLILIIGTINVLNYRSIQKNADTLLSLIMENGGVFPPIDGNFSGSGGNNHFRDGLSPESPFETRYFTVLLGRGGTAAAIDTGRIAAVSTETAQDYAQTLFAQGKTQGFYAGYKFRAVQTERGLLYVFLDCSRQTSSFYHFLFYSLVISVAGILLVLILVVVFSKIAVKPVAESYEKQKRFITDAGHEIKTPLTIIDANVEVMEMTGGESEWTGSIRNQVKRLTALTEKLVFLSRMDEENMPLNMTDFSLSGAVKEIAASFEAVALAKGKTLTADIQENIVYHGEETSLRQLVSLLIDNALKYSDENGSIHCSLKITGKHPQLKISNTTIGIAKGPHEEFFERFYRGDASRNSKTGGHGIGLSVAQAIVNVHKGKLSAFSEDGRTITLTATL